MRVFAASIALNGSESSARRDAGGRVFCAAKRASTAGSLTTCFTCSRNVAGSSSGSMRTSSVAFASDGITLER